METKIINDIIKLNDKIRKYQKMIFSEGKIYDKKYLTSECKENYEILAEYYCYIRYEKDYINIAIVLNIMNTIKNVIINIRMYRKLDNNLLNLIDLILKYIDNNLIL